jgi:hypothetical protein
MEKPTSHLQMSLQHRDVCTENTISGGNKRAAEIGHNDKDAFDIEDNKLGFQLMWLQSFRDGEVLKRGNYLLICVPKALLH